MSLESEHTRNLPIITEEVDPDRMINAVMHNYRDAQSAFMELVDNAVDNRLSGNPLRITIRARKNELFISNNGGKGLDFDGLRKFFTWGYSDKRDQDDQIGEYGQGGKAAMGYLGSSIQVVCSAQDSDTAYIVSDPNWREGREKGLKRLTPREIKTDIAEGYFNVTIKNLNKRVDSGLLVRRLGEIYRPLLIPENGDAPNVTITVNGERVQPLEIPYLLENGFAPITYRVENRLGHSPKVTIGILSPENKDVRSGIRCYVHGRLISEGELFGIPTSLPGSSRLTGEAHLDDIPVTANKSDFDKDSEEWKATASSIERLLKDNWLEKIKSLPHEKLNHPSREEINLAARLKMEFEDFLKATHFLSKKDLTGSSSGREPSERSGTDRPASRGGTHASPEGRTPPGENSTEGKNKIKRWGPFDDWMPRSLGNSRDRSALIEDKGKKTLSINTDYTAYQKALRSGMTALDLYYTETVALEIARHMRPDSVEEYIENFNDLVRQFTEYRDSKSQKKKGDVFTRQK